MPALKKNRLVVAVPLCWLLGATVMPVSAQRPDTIVPADGGQNIRAKISKVTTSGVEATVQGASTKIPANEIDSIAFGDEPTGIRQAREAIHDGQLDQAQQALGRVDPDNLDREAVKQEYEYLHALLKTRQAAEGQASVTEASNAMLQFLKKNKTSYHFFPAVEKLGDLKMQSGDFEKAARYYANLGRAPWPETKMRSAVLAADALRAQGNEKCPEAVKRYDQVISVKTSDPVLRRQQAMAITGRATCLAQLGQADTAIADLHKIIQDNDPQDVELFARTYNALGDCYRLAGKKQDAVLEYLHVDLLFFRNSAAHAEALYWLSKLQGEIGHPARGNQARSLLKSRYGSTVWARRHD